MDNFSFNREYKNIFLQEEYLTRLQINQVIWSNFIKEQLMKFTKEKIIDLFSNIKFVYLTNVLTSPFLDFSEKELERLNSVLSILQLEKTHSIESYLLYMESYENSKIEEFKSDDKIIETKEGLFYVWE